MKKGMTAGQLVIMLIAIIGFIFFLIYIVAPTWSTGKEFLLKKLPNITQIFSGGEVSTSVPGATVKYVPTAFKQLGGTRDQILDAIAADLRACWNQVLRTKKDQLKWTEIIFVKTDPVFTRKELIDAVGGPSTEIGKSLDGKWGSGDQYPRGDTLPGNIGYLICCDYDSNWWPIADDADLYITNNLMFDCE